ncbi:MAG: 4Fe-4S dicluster domain-containing protein [Armatimonadota bacterium]|nr:4Fe-4S dicluster domain-containing protein [Armatimonadota bacterium]
MKLIWSKLKEAVICLAAGRVTLPYPFAPHPPEEGFRGLPQVDVDRCVGCGGCAAVCPSRLIRIVDIDQQTRALIFLYERCIYCGRCEEVCPEGAIEMTDRSELASDDVHGDLVVEYRIYMGACQRCGRCYEPPTPLDRLMHTGTREDEIDQKRPMSDEDDRS